MTGRSAPGKEKRMEKIYVVNYGTWEYEESREAFEYFATWKSAVRFALRLRRDVERPELSRLPRTKHNRKHTEWCECCDGGYCGSFVSVKEVDVNP